ncbi:MAG: hypothetical protein JNK58_03185 [Phycisphaerae bacterium]|nr:hypothetical protein [Phycisphaerae bacterium]
MRAFIRGVVVIAAALVPSLSAVAQPGMMGGFGGGQMFDPGVSTRDLDKYAEFLSMTPEQKEAAAALLDGYQTEFDRMAKEMREATDAAREEFRDTRDFTVWDDLRPKMEAFQAKRKELEGTLLRDVKDLMTDEQAARWPELERLRRRDTTLRRGFLSGETVDVVKLVEDSALPAEAMEQVRPLLSQYEIELDRVLIERNEQYEAGMGQGMALFRQGDMAAVNELFNKAREAGAKVRDVNRRYARLIEGVIPEGQREKFSREFKERSFPRVYREGFAGRALDAAVNFKDVTEEQRSRIAEIRQSYDRDAEAINVKWSKAIEENEMTITPMEMMGGGGGPALREGRTARRELDQRTVDKLKAVLTEDQVKRLPERRERDEADGDRPMPRPRRGET